MITKDEITMYICNCALFLKEMLMLVMNSFGTLFHDKIFSLTFPWHVSNALTFPGFPDKWSPCILRTDRWTHKVGGCPVKWRDRRRCIDEAERWAVVLNVEKEHATVRSLQQSAASRHWSVRTIYAQQQWYETDFVRISLCVHRYSPKWQQLQHTYITIHAHTHYIRERIIYNSWSFLLYFYGQVQLTCLLYGP